MGLCAGSPPQNPQFRSGGSDRTPPGDDIFTDILSSNQGSSRFMLQGDIAVGRNRNALTCRGKSCLWPKTANGWVQVPYTLSNSYAPEEKTLIQAAMEEVAVLTCVRFIPRQGEPSYLRIQPNDGCWSYVGRLGGAQDLSLTTPGCLHWGVIQHELLHALGFQHEQCRSDRDKYIRINWGNISQDKERNFYKMSTQTLGVPYDYLSVLHYGKFAFATDSGKPTLEPTGDPHALIGQRVGLSSLDVSKIKKLYECNVCSHLLPDAHGKLSWESKKNPNLTACVWLIRVPEDKVFLQFESFSIQPSPDCAQASVTAYDGIGTEAAILLHKSCGNIAPLAQISSGRFLKIQFTGSGTGSSFKATYSSSECMRWPQRARRSLEDPPLCGGPAALWRTRRSLEDPPHPGGPSTPWRTLRTLEDLPHPGGPTALWRTRRTLEDPPQPGGPAAPWRTLHTLEDPPHPGGPSAPWRTCRTLEDPPLSGGPTTLWRTLRTLEDPPLPGRLLFSGGPTTLWRTLRTLEDPPLPGRLLLSGGPTTLWRTLRTLKNPLHPGGPAAPWRTRHPLEDPPLPVGPAASWRTRRTLEDPPHPGGPAVPWRTRHSLEDPPHPGGPTAPCRTHRIMEDPPHSGGPAAPWRTHRTLEDPPHPGGPAASWRTLRTLKDPPLSGGPSAPWRTICTLGDPPPPGGPATSCRTRRIMEDPPHSGGPTAPWRTRRTLEDPPLPGGPTTPWRTHRTL
ncbi:unnamed protein product [Ranitomeya imitator]|uniref:Metalloendopeptidase n=1 Tax=Ranitomeya imitator TaxID=111125 RepID=A0ABN9KN84_9NEOB|nr:unnamed protein product [Ranitomeya imitator]